MKLNKPKFWDVPKISFWAIILLPLSFIFLLASFIRKTLKIENKFQIPIICVGNIYIGGTGKTPLASEIYKIVKSWLPVYFSQKNSVDFNIFVKKSLILFKGGTAKSIYKHTYAYEFNKIRYP